MPEDDWETEWNKAGSSSKRPSPSVAASSAEVAVPAGHPQVVDGNSAFCPFLMRNATDSVSHEVSNGGVVPRAIYLITFLDMLAVGLVIPLLPAYAKSLGASATMVGAMGTAYGLAQLIGSSTLGKLSDHRGRRRVLQISMLGAACGYATIIWSVGTWRSLVCLLCSRIPIGLAKQTMSMSRAVVADCTSPADRTAALSKLGVTVGLGFIFGPAFGGMLSARYFLGPPILSVMLFVTAFMLVRTLPETAPNVLANNPAASSESDETKEPSTPGLLSSWMNTLSGSEMAKYPQLVVFLAAKAIITLSYQLMEFSFSLYTSERFLLTPKHNGFVLGYAGLVAVIAQMGGVAFLKKRYSDRLLVIIGAAVLSGSLLGIAAASTLPAFLVAVAFLSLGRAIFRTVCDTIVMQAVAPEDVGMVSGACDAVDSACRVSAPLIGGFLIEWYGVASPPCLGGVMILVGIIVIQTGIQWNTAVTDVSDKKGN